MARSGPALLCAKGSSPSPAEGCFLLEAHFLFSVVEQTARLAQGGSTRCNFHNLSLNLCSWQQHSPRNTSTDVGGTGELPQGLQRQLQAR